MEKSHYPHQQPFNVTPRRKSKKPVKTQTPKKESK
ncbi:hypothetical protein [EBPR podovirus 3]|nr:hypothetical protein [EBPR podovirus 3]